MNRDDARHIAEQLLETAEEAGRKGFLKAILGFFSRKGTSSRTADRLRESLGLDSQNSQMREVFERGVSRASNQVNIKAKTVRVFVGHPANRNALLELIIDPEAEISFEKGVLMGAVEKRKIQRFLTELPSALEDAKTAVYSAEGQEVLQGQDRIRSDIQDALSYNFRSWKEWRKSGHHKISLAAPKGVQGKIDDIRQRLEDPPTILRVVGLSGLGKTRLVMEALRPPSHDDENTGRADFSGRTLYEPNGGVTNPPLCKAVERLVKSDEDVVVVVDDCGVDLHNELEEIVVRDGSQVQLITLDYDFQGGRPGATAEVELRPDSQAPVVGEMLRESPLAEEFNDSDLDRAERYAQGYPEIARLILEAWKEDRGVWS